MLASVLLTASVIAFAGGSGESTATRPATRGTVEITLTNAPMTINVWAISGAMVAQWKMFEKLYEADNPNIDIVVTSIDPPDAMRQLAGPAVAGGKEDLDIIWYWGGGRPFEWFEAGLVHDLKPFYDYYNWGANMVSGYEPYAFMADGSMPWFCTDWVSMPFLFYNKDIFSKVGIDPDSLATFEDFLALGDKLQAAGYIPMITNGTSPNQLSWMQSLIAARVMGPEMYAKLRSWPVDSARTAKTAEIYKSPEAIESFRLTKLVIDKLLPKNFATYDDAAANQAFINGRAAMRLGGSWFIPTYKALNVARMNLPPIRKGGYAPTFSFFANGVSIPAYVSDAKLDRIVDILNSILSRKYAIEVFKSGIAWSTSANASEADISATMDPMYFQTLKMMAETGTDTVQLFLFNADSQATYAALSAEVWNGLLSPEAACDKVYNALLRTIPK
jgi:ABC-type glycerol-3-phosphate transport system substrate-binding protein